jgi:hypothetical protein
MRKQIKVNDYKDKLIARLDFGSRSHLRAIADKYVQRLGQRIIDIFDAFANLTGNLNTYFTDFQNKEIGLRASNDAIILAKKTAENID